MLGRFAYVFGGSISACNWLRLPKLCLSYVVLFKQSSAESSRQASSLHRKLAHLFYIVGATTHISACGWFFIGNNYEVRVYILTKKLRFHNEFKSMMLPIH